MLYIVFHVILLLYIMLFSEYISSNIVRVFTIIPLSSVNSENRLKPTSQFSGCG